MLFPRPFISFPSSASLHYHFSFRTFLRVRFLSSSPVAPFENPASDPPAPRKRLCGNDFDNDLMMMIFMSSLHVLRPDYLLVFSFFFVSPLTFWSFLSFPFTVILILFLSLFSLRSFSPIYPLLVLFFFYFFPSPYTFYPYLSFPSTTSPIFFLSLSLPPFTPVCPPPPFSPIYPPNPSSRFLSSPT